MSVEICQFPWCKYSHFGLFQATTRTSGHAELAQTLPSSRWPSAVAVYVQVGVWVRAGDGKKARGRCKSRGHACESRGTQVDAGRACGCGR